MNHLSQFSFHFQKCEKKKTKGSITYCEMLALMLFGSTQCRFIDDAIGLPTPSVEELEKGEIFHLSNGAKILTILQWPRWCFSPPGSPKSGRSFVFGFRWWIISSPSLLASWYVLFNFSLFFQIAFVWDINI